MTKLSSTPTKASISRSSSSIPVAVDSSSGGNRKQTTSVPSAQSLSTAAVASASSNLSSSSSLSLAQLNSKGSSSFTSGLPTSKEPMEMGTNEKILAEISGIYNKEAGLLQTAKMLNVESQISPPQRKVTILLIGNHSAGKSSFINWYIQEPVLKTGVATETQGVNLIVSGSRRETLKGAATLELYPQLKKLKKIPGLVNNLVTEVSPSRLRNFDLVTFIDTPGLVDGNMNYPFDINKTLVTLGEMADQIFVFFEPIGQALCKRTLDILEEMWALYGDSKIRLYLAKADEAGGDRDRQKVLMQIVQELCKRPGINRTAFDMPAIYIPSSLSLSSDVFGRGNKLAPRCANQIEEVCKEIERAVGMNVQNALENLDNDCCALERKLKKRLEEDAATRSVNSERRGSKFIHYSLILFLLLLVVSGFATTVAKTSQIWAVRYLGQSVKLLFNVIGIPFVEMWTIIPEKIHWVILALLMGCAMVLWYLSGRIQSEEVIPSKKRAGMQLALEFIKKAQNKRTNLFRTYLMQSLPDIEVEVVNAD